MISIRCTLILTEVMQITDKLLIISIYIDITQMKD